MLRKQGPLGGLVACLLGASVAIQVAALHHAAVTHKTCLATGCGDSPGPEFAAGGAILFAGMLGFVLATVSVALLFSRLVFRRSGLGAAVILGLALGLLGCWPYAILLLNWSVFTLGNG